MLVLVRVTLCLNSGGGLSGDGRGSGSGSCGGGDGACGGSLGLLGGGLGLGLSLLLHHSPSRHSDLFLLLLGLFTRSPLVRLTVNLFLVVKRILRTSWLRTRTILAWMAQEMQYRVFR